MKTSRTLVFVLVVMAWAVPGLTAPVQAICTAERTANLDFVLEDLDGNSVRLADFRGSVILLDFWATWCAPCKIEIPAFVQMVEQYGSQGFVALGVAVDDTVESLRDFAGEYGMNYPVLDGNQSDEIKAAYDVVDEFPRTFVIGRDGEVCSEHTGYAPPEVFEEAIRELL